MLKLAFQLIVAGSIAAQTPPGFGSGDFFFLQWPDTQHYYVYGPAYWPTAAFNVHSWNPRPVYATHVGDFTQNAVQQEFDYGLYCMSLMGTTIPWGVSMGNHDYDSLVWPRDRTTWTANMGAANFVSIVNTPQGPLAFLHLEYNAPDQGLATVMSWLESHPFVPAVLTTHNWIDRVNAARRSGETDRDGDGPNDSEDVWQKLVQTHPQIVLVCCGHAHAVRRRTDTTIMGRVVEQHLFNTQDDPYGGQGWVRLYGYLADRLWIATFSVTWSGLPPDRTELYSIPYDLPAVRAELAATNISRHFPVQDTFLVPCWGGGSVRGNWTHLWAATGGCDEHGLMQFNLAGVSSCSQAILTVTCEGYSTDGHGFSVHRMLRPWTENDSWNSLGGLQAGVDYRATPDAIQTAHGKITLNIDVTTAVQAWAAGAPNHGFLFRGLGESSGFRTREWQAWTERPRLTVKH